MASAGSSTETFRIEGNELTVGVIRMAHPA
jgi:hypothetical protein